MIGGPGLPGSLLLQAVSTASHGSPPARQVEPMRDYCPALRNVRLRLAKRLRMLEQEIGAIPQALLRNGHGKRLAEERDAIVASLDRLLTASQRDLAPRERIGALESLLAELPRCVTEKARSRVRLIIEGLGSGS